MRITDSFMGTDTIGATPYRIGFGTNHAVKLQFELDFGWRAVGTMLTLAGVVVWASRGRSGYHYPYRSPPALPPIYLRPTRNLRKPRLNPAAENQEPLQDKHRYPLLQGVFLGICGWNMLAAFVTWHVVPENMTLDDNDDNKKSDDNADKHKNQNDDDCVETQAPSAKPSQTSLTVRPKDVELLSEGSSTRIGKVHLGGVTWNVDVQSKSNEKLVGFYLSHLPTSRHQLSP